MFQKIAFYLYQFVYWLLFFVVVKLLFLSYHYELSLKLSFYYWIMVVKHGLSMDLSAAGYLMIIPSVLLIFIGVSGWKTWQIVLGIYTLIVLFGLSLLAVVDLEIYKYWGFHIDTTPLTYLKNMNEAFASVSIWLIVRQIIIALILFFLFAFLYFKILKIIIKPFSKTSWWFTPPLFILLTASLILPIRGGVGVSPMNAGCVYFHQNQFANHAAVNYFWNLGNSLINIGSTENPYTVFEDKKAFAIKENLYLCNDSTLSLLKQDRPNVLVILLESFTSNIIDLTVEGDSISPNLSRYCREGIFFKNMYASGDRSDKALVSTFSGYPAIPTHTIIVYPAKATSLPGLPHSFRKDGYQTAFYYGGDITFTGMNSYLSMVGFDKMISRDDFPKKFRNSKWGVHDQYVFDKMFEDLEKATIPFFYSIFTLSSHEPFEIPTKPLVEHVRNEFKFLNTINYTDKVLGEFIEKARKTKWWDNTLIVIMADHGSPFPNNVAYNSPEKFHIPMLWLGGAIQQKGRVIHQVCSQVDFSKTLLNQLNLKDTDFIYSKNILNPNASSFAYYAFNNGFGFIEDSANVIYDYKSNTMITPPNEHSDSLLIKGKAFLQVLYNDFLKR